MLYECCIDPAPWPTAILQPCRTQLQCEGKPIHALLEGCSPYGTMSSKWWAAHLHRPGEEDSSIRSQFFHVEIHGAAVSWAYRQGLFVSLQRESSDQLRWCSSGAEAVIRFTDNRKSALRPAFKETTAPVCKSRLHPHTPCSMCCSSTLGSGHTLISTWIQWKVCTERAVDNPQSAEMLKYTVFIHCVIWANWMQIV